MRENENIKKYTITSSEYYSDDYDDEVEYSRNFNFLIGEIIEVDKSNFFNSSCKSYDITIDESFPYINISYDEDYGPVYNEKGEYVYNKNGVIKMDIDDVYGYFDLNLGDKNLCLIKPSLYDFEYYEKIFKELEAEIFDSKKFKEINAIHALRFVFSENVELETSKETVLDELKKAADKSVELSEYLFQNGIFPRKDNKTMVDFFQFLKDDFDIPRDTYLYIKDDEIFGKYNINFMNGLQGQPTFETVAIMKVDKNNLWDLSQINDKGIQKLQEIDKEKDDYYKKLNYNLDKDRAISVLN